MKRAPSYAQMIVLGVLVRGGWLDAGNPGESCPRLYDGNGRLWSPVPRRTFDALGRRSWIEAYPGPIGRPRFRASTAGEMIAGEYRS